MSNPNRPNGTLTVADLIARLQHLPKDAVVFVSRDSEYRPLVQGDILLQDFSPFGSMMTQDDWDILREDGLAVGVNDYDGEPELVAKQYVVINTWD